MVVQHHMAQPGLFSPPCQTLGRVRGTSSRPHGIWSGAWPKIAMRPVARYVATYLVYLGVSNVIHAWELSSDHPILNLQVLFSNSVLSGARWVQMSPNAAKVFE